MSCRELNTHLCVSRIIKAPRQRVYAAFLDADAVGAWLPPKGMRAQVHAFEPRAGGAYEMTLTYLSTRDRPRGKTTDDSDTVRGRFAELVPDERIVQVVAFDSADAAFADAMTITWSFADVPGGTEVTVDCENAPAAVRHQDHETGVRSTLANLAVYVE
jgi:uncharacterized protein YndB with AHSA1/START domain